MSDEQNKAPQRVGGRHHCVYRNCNNSSSKSDNIKLHSFPKEEMKCRIWIEACGREDLLEKEENISIFYKKYKVCSEHFEGHMFNNIRERLRLMDSAFPVDYKTHSCNNPSTSRERDHVSSIVSTPRTTTELSEDSTMLIPTSSPECSSAVPQYSHVETQTESFISNNTPRKEKLRRKIKSLENEITILRKELENTVSKDNQTTEENFTKLTEKFLSPEVAKFVINQVNLNNSNKFGKRYTDEFKEFSLTLYFLSPKCYREMQKTFSLPSPRSLCRFVEKIKLSAGYNQVLFDILKLKVNQMSPLDKFCTVIIDEMSIKTNLFYNFASDEVIGLEDNGETKSVDPASSATVVMVRSLKCNWKQPIAYFFSSTTYKAENIKNLLDAIVEQLFVIGLRVVGFVNDMGSNCIELANILGVSKHNSKITLGGQQIFFIFDPCHLIKAVRNNMLHNELTWDCKSTSWKHIEYLYENDKASVNRLVPKLSHAHIKPTNFEKMKVNLATQVLSNTVAASLKTHINLNNLPKTAMATVDLISKFNKLFDLFNSSTLYSDTAFKTSFKGEQFQLDFLDDMECFLNKLNVFKGSKKIYVKFIDCWIVSIHSLKGLWNVLKPEGFIFLFTRKLNQDPLENFFGCIRQQSGNAVNPTSIQFTRAFRQLFILKLIHSKNMNCADDLGNLLFRISDFKTPENSDSCIFSRNTTKQIVHDFRIGHCDYQEKCFPEQNAFKYVSGYLIDKCLKIHSCETCKTFSKGNNEVDESNYFIHFKAYDHDHSLFGGLKHPHESFYNYIYALEKTFFDNIENCITDHPANYIYNLFTSLDKFNHPCIHFPHQYLLKLFLRLRIYYVMKNSNASFKAVPKKNRKLNIVMNM